MENGLHFRSALLADGWARNVRMCFEHGHISHLERDVGALPGDERGGIALPGIPNLHSHAFQRGMAGLAEKRGPGADTFWTWRDLMYRFVGRLSPDDLEAIAAQAYVEMLEAGFTRVGEFHYLHHDPSGKPYANVAEMGQRLVAAAERTGIGITLLPVFYAHSGFGGAPPGAAQVRFLNDMDSYARLVEESRSVVSHAEGGRIGVAPHSLRAVTREELFAIIEMAEANAPIHIHIAEQLREVEDCKAWSGARPVEWLLDTAPVNARWCLVHATHTTDAEVLRVAQSGAVAGLCPITEANLGDGLFPGAAFQSAGGIYGVGSDSNVLISASEELRLLEYGQRLREQARNVMTGPNQQSSGRALFDMAVRGGAQALGSVPGLHAGAPADVIALREDHIALAAREEDRVLDTFVFAGGRELIEGVWRAGAKVVSGGVHRERAAVAARFRSTLEKLVRT